MSGQEQVGSEEGLQFVPVLPQDKKDLETEEQESEADESGKQARKAKKKYSRHPKPPYSYVAMIALVIQKSPERKLKLSEIIKEVSTQFPFFPKGYDGWKDSIRHNLSSSSCFYKVLKDPTKPNAKGNFWTVDVNRISDDALRLQNTPISRKEARMFAVDLTPYVRHGWPFPSSPAAQDFSAPERRVTSLSEAGSTAQQHSPFSIDSLLSDFQDVGLARKSKVGAEQLLPASANSMDMWGPVPIFCVSSGPPVFPYRPPYPLPVLEPSLGNNPTASSSMSLHEREAGGQAFMEAQLAKQPRVLQAPSSSSSALELPASYTNCYTPNKDLKDLTLSHLPPFSALPFHGGPVPCISPMYWDVQAGHSLRSLPPPTLPVNMDETAPPNKTVFDTWRTRPVETVELAIGREDDFSRSPLLNDLDIF